MPARKRSKKVKFRGSRTCGWGKHSRHRGHGSQGGTGMAGGKKHKKTWMVKFAPNRIGKFGFHSLKQKGVKEMPKIINVSEIESMAAGRKELEFSGRVLGGGNIASAVTVKASYFTEQAKAKIEKAGGKCISLGGEEGTE